jgi:predicted transposase/invertase (TIGR01784 family)
MVTRYIDPTTDFGFKRLFGREDSREILKQFLFDVLELPHPIRELTFLPAEQLPPVPDDRTSIFDIYCTDERGQRFIVEMQRNWQMYFKERTLYYSTFPITQQVEKGPWEYDLLPVYCLSIANFRIDDDARYLRRAQLMDIETGSVFYDKLTYVFIELPKFNRPLNEITTAADYWVYLLKRLPELQAIPAELARPPFTTAFGIAEAAALSPAERWAYEASLKHARDDRATLQSAIWKGLTEGRQQGLEEGRQQGLEEGRQEGLQEGRQEAKYAIARAMLAKGLDVAVVAELTGLTPEEIAVLR